MEKHLISGIQQIGLGTEDFRKSWNWIIDMFGADVRILEDDTVAERMLPYTGGRPQKRHACITVNLQGGGGYEVWQFSERKPQPCGFEIAVGDLGVLAAKVKCRDIPAFHRQISAKCAGMMFCEVPMQPAKMPVASAESTCSSAPAKKIASFGSFRRRAWTVQYL